jgi:hypothetical protein
LSTKQGKRIEGINNYRASTDREEEDRAAQPRSAYSAAD